MRARWYEPVTGRFISRDPVSPDNAQPRTLNSYGYAYANPALVTDPTGLWGGIDDLAAIAGGALVGGAFSIGAQWITTGTVDWGEVAISAATGAVAAEVSLYAGPLAGGAAAGFVGGAARQVYANRGFDNFNTGELAFDTVSGAATGFLGATRGLGGPSPAGRAAFQASPRLGATSTLFSSVRGNKGLLNDNDVVRAGWGFRSGRLQNFRIGIGNPKWTIGKLTFHIHVDFWNP
jgi:hypothetical protein